MSSTVTINNNKRIALNRRATSLLLDYTTRLEEEKKHQSVVVSRYCQESQLKPSLRRMKSAPASPTKSVQFDTNNLENICYFKQAHTPLTISHRKNKEWTEESDDEDDEEQKELVFSNWPERQLTHNQDKRTKIIRIEQSSLRIQGNRLIGKVLVRNLDYQKTVTLRHSFDHWRTVQNTQAVYYQNYPSNSMYDVFTFSLEITSDTLYFAIHYQVGSQEFWDNNQSSNYQLSFRSKKKKVSPPKTRYSFPQINQPPSPSPPLSRRLTQFSLTMDLNSASYMDLVSKYCFYDSACHNGSTTAYSPLFTC
ncbi:putative phosphatase regulatory subunit-domain-containing protein [Sporodiniella umbellata]|nr:putative phosphatase regulatory subunit-domain-containing protein [Sporodiniella umbellata]